MQRRKSTPASYKIIFPQEQTHTFSHQQTSVFRLIRRNQLRFLGIEINKPLLVPLHSVSKVRFKFGSQFKLLLQIRCLITIRIKCSIISIDSNVTDNIIRKVINVLQEKCRTKNGGHPPKRLDFPVVYLSGVLLPTPSFCKSHNRL